MAVRPGFYHGVNYANLATSIFDFEGRADDSLYEGIVKVGNLGANLGMGKKEAIMASVNVDDLWLVFPELTPPGKKPGSGPERAVREQQFAEDVHDAAHSVRMNTSYDRLRWAFEDASIGVPVDEVKEAV